MPRHFGVRIDFTCPICGTTIPLIASRANSRKTCSKSCAAVARNKGITAELAPVLSTPYLVDNRPSAELELSRTWSHPQLFTPEDGEV